MHKTRMDWQTPDDEIKKEKTVKFGWSQAGFDGEAQSIGRIKDLKK